MDATGLVGAVKVKDGLFLGDEFAAQDLEFVVANKVTHIVNCAARQVPNHWEPIGVRYLAYTWLDQDLQVILDPRDEVFRDVFNFVERAASNGESVLIHGVRDISKSEVLVTSYLMRKFSWGMFKALEFLGSRVANMHLSPGLIHQLSVLESRLTKAGLGPKSTDWTVVRFEDEEEMMLQNTFLNARLLPQPPQPGPVNSRRVERIQWRDNGSGEVTRLTSPHAGANNPVVDGFVFLHSALKGSSSRPLRVPVRATLGKRLGKQKLDYLTDNSRFAKTVETALEYGNVKYEQTPQARGRTGDLVSPTHSDPPKDFLTYKSLRSGKKLRAASADNKEIEPKPTFLPAKRPIKLNDFVSVTELQVRETPSATRTVPVKATSLSKSASLLPKAKRPVTAPSKRPPSPTMQGRDMRPKLGQSRTTGKLPGRPQPWHM